MRKILSTESESFEEKNSKFKWDDIKSKALLELRFDESRKKLFQLAGNNPHSINRIWVEMGKTLNYSGLDHKTQ